MSVVRVFSPSVGKFILEIINHRDYILNFYLHTDYIVLYYFSTVPSRHRHLNKCFSF